MYCVFTLYQLQVGRGGHADVETDRRRAPHTIDDPLFERPKQCLLSDRAEIANLVQEDRSAVGCQLETTAPPLAGPRIGAALMAEELRLHKRLDDGAAIEHDQRPRRPRPMMVQRLRHDFLASACLPTDQYRVVGVGDRFHLLVQVLDRKAMSHQASDGFPQAAVGLVQGRVMLRNGPGDRGSDDIIIERLCHVVERTGPNGVDRTRDAALARDHDDRQRAALASEAGQHFFSAEIGHPHVEQYRGRVGLCRDFQTGRPGIGFSDGEAKPANNCAERPTHILVVIDDQNW